MRQGHSVRLMRRWFIYYSVTAAMLLGALPCYPGTVISEFTGPDEAFFVKSLKDEVWLGTLRGLFRWIDGQAVQVEGVRRIPRLVTEVGGEIWIGTDGGLYRWIDGQAVQVEGVRSTPRLVTEVGGEIWIGTGGGLYRWIDGQAVQVEGVHWRPRLVIEVDGEIWVGTDGGLYRWVDGQAVGVWAVEVLFQRRKGQTFEEARGRTRPRFVTEVDGEIWVGTDGGLYRWIDGQAVQVEGVRRIPRLVTEVGVSGEIWIGSDRGLYRWIDGQAVQVEGVRRSPRFVTEAGGEIWIGTDEGLSRWVDADVNFQLVSADSWWKNVIVNLLPGSLMDGDFLLDGEIQVHVDVSGPDADKVPKERFLFILESYAERLRDKIKHRRFSDTGALKLAATGIGRQKTIYLAVKTLDGSIESDLKFERWVIPSQATSGVILLLIWVLLCWLIIAFAARKDWCMAVLMNPYMRRFGSFGLIPLVISISPPMQRHLLKLYRRNLLKSGVIQEAQLKYQLPDSTRLDQAPNHILREHRRVYVRADSGYGKTLLSRYLTGVWASDPNQAPNRATPIYLGLSQLNGVAPQKMIQGELSNHGNLTDTKLVDWLFAQGGFIVIFDGLNEVSEGTQNQIASFVQHHWQRNYFIMTSQYPRSWPEFHCIQLEPLQPAAIRKIIRQRLPSQAEEIWVNLSDDQYRLFSRPQDLNLALEILATNPAATLPNEEVLLYQSLFCSQIEEWSSCGLDSYGRWLQVEAYHMVRDSRPMDPDAPADVVAFLKQMHLVSLRGKDLYFSHDLVRAYLAALYFAPEWQTLIIEDKSQINEKWFDIFTFSTRLLLESGCGSEVFRDISNQLLFIDANLSIRYVKWLEQNHHSLCEPWLGEFERTFGAHSLASI